MNILLIFADQMHKNALGCLDPAVITPHLDKLAEQGTLFESAYSNNPLCTPFRGNVLTGMYSSKSKVMRNCDALPTDVTTLAEALHQHGYQTAFTGKWHLGATGNQPIPKALRGGFSQFFGYQCYNGFYKDVCFFDEQNREHRFSGHRTEVTTEKACEQLEGLIQADKPFFQMVFYQAPHYPVQPSEKFERLYRDRDVSYPPAYQPVDPYTPTQSPKSPRPFERCPDYQRYGNDPNAYLRLYYAMVSQVDEGVGKLLRTLEEHSIRQNTFVLFASDHGDMQGSHGLVQKNLPHEYSCGIPMIASVPKGVRNIRCKKPVSGIDIMPTCLDLVGATPVDTVQGVSLRNILYGQHPIEHPPVYAECFSSHPWVMRRDDRFKYVYDMERSRGSMLFDMINDPNEMKNLVDDPAWAAVLQEQQIEIQHFCNS